MHLLALVFVHFHLLNSSDEQLKSCIAQTLEKYNMLVDRFHTLEQYYVKMERLVSQDEDSIHLIQVSLLD